MSRFWPHAAYAENQPLGRLILTSHVLQRGFEAGSIAGASIGSAWHLVSRWRASGAAQRFAPMVLRSTGVGAVVGTGLMVVGLPVRMWGREEIEWQDRSWRLLENQGQLEVDDWSVGGVTLGLATIMLRGGVTRGLGWQGVVGAAGLGSMAGIAGYMGWRYGVNGGQR
jgi:hypothetical protein